MTEQSEPLTYGRIEDGIRKGLNLQVELTEQFAETGDALAAADVEYKRAYAVARATYRAEGEPRLDREQGFKKYTQDALEDLANESTINEYSAYLHAKAAHDAVRQKLTSVRTRLDALRSLMASHRQVTT